MNRSSGLSLAVAVCASVFSACGCVLGPTALQVSRTRYNEVIHETTSEQLLLNLVRLRYREDPLFIEVGNVSAQFVFDESAGAVGTLNENVGADPLNANQLRLDAGVAYQERPTITYSPLQGEDFVARLLTPLPLDTIVLTYRSGWSVDRVLRLTLSSMNGLDNASNAASPTPDHPPRYERFTRASRAMRRLQQRGLLQFVHVATDTELSDPIGTDRVNAEDVIKAADAGYRFRIRNDGGTVVLTEPRNELTWRIPAAAGESAEVRELIELLQLEPGLPAYTVSHGAGAVSPRETGQRFAAITIETRSLLGAMFYLSQAVDVPRKHREQGLVTTTLNDDGSEFDWLDVTGELLRIQCSRLPPRQAAVAVRYRGYWFYVDDTDLDSKSTFALLRQLFSLQAGQFKGAAPVLTLPVGG